MIELEVKSMRLPGSTCMKYEVIVVGAGPAGSTAAKFLSEKGLNVLLIDKSNFPRDKPCAGGLPYRVLNRFPYVKDKDLIESYSYGSFAYSPSLKYKAGVQDNKPIVAMVIRKKFDMKLAQLAANSGADFIDGKTVENIKITKDKAKIILDDKEEIDSEIIVGADGVWSTVAKKSGLTPIKRRVGMCVFQEYNVDEKTIDKLIGKEKMCHIHLKFQDISGYGWVFPKKQHLNIGIIDTFTDIDLSKKKTNLLNIYKDYFKTLKKTKIIPENLKIGQCKGGALPVVPLEKTYTDRIVVVGDAAGFINPISGEGIYYAISSGEIAARVITESLEVGDTSEKFLSKYQVKWKQDFGKDIEIFLRSAKIGKKAEKLVKFATRDEKLAEIALGVLHGRLSVQEYRWKLIRRYIYDSVKDLFIKERA